MQPQALAAPRCYRRPGPHAGHAARAGRAASSLRGRLRPERAQLAKSTRTHGPFHFSQAPPVEYLLVGEATDIRVFARYPHSTYLRQDHLDHVNMNSFHARTLIVHTKPSMVPDVLMTLWTWSQVTAQVPSARTSNLPDTWQ